jgi:hypothetical protein
MYEIPKFHLLGRCLNWLFFFCECLSLRHVLDRRDVVFGMYVPARLIKETYRSYRLILCQATSLHGTVHATFPILSDLKLALKTRGSVREAVLTNLWLTALTQLRPRTLST